jgi:hypothetical protein
MSLLLKADDVEMTQPQVSESDNDFAKVLKKNRYLNFLKKLFRKLLKN